MTRRISVLVTLTILGLCSLAFAASVPDPAASPADSASLLYQLYKAGHLIPAIILAVYFGLVLAQKWFAWLREGYRKLVIASVLAGLGMIAERAADGTTPNLTMVMGAIGAALAMYVNTKGEEKAAAEVKA